MAAAISSGGAADTDAPHVDPGGSRSQPLSPRASVPPRHRAVVLASMVAVMTVDLADWPPVVALPVVLWFIAVVPGLALAFLLPAGDRLARSVLVVAVSLGLATVSAELLAIARLWSSTAVLAVLALISLIGLAVPSKRFR